MVNDETVECDSYDRGMEWRVREGRGKREEGRGTREEEGRGGVPRRLEYPTQPAIVGTLISTLIGTDRTYRSLWRYRGRREEPIPCTDTRPVAVAVLPDWGFESISDLNWSSIAHLHGTSESLGPSVNVSTSALRTSKEEGRRGGWRMGMGVRLKEVKVESVL